MPTKSTESNSAAARRRSVARRRIGIGNECKCGENRPLALIAGSSPITCVECRRRKKGHKTIDRHHVAGRANHDFTIPVPANDHRATLTDDQYRWPKQTLDNPDSSPLLAAAGCIRGVIDTIAYLLDNLLLWIAQLLEHLDAFLTSRFGVKWWENMEIAVFLRLGDLA